MRTDPPLGAAAQQLYDDFSARWELDPGELEILESACRTVDELQRLETELDATLVIVPGPRGSRRPNPLLDEVRRHRAALAALLGSLRVDVQTRTVSEAASVIALSRWKKAKSL